MPPTAPSKRVRPLSRAARAGLMMAPRSGVKVRMYRQGLGDCFLLAFRKRSGRPFHLLIDCGVIIGQQPGRPEIGEIVEDIGLATQNHLDLLVVTHQHWDHLSGFVDAAEAFRRMKVDRLWLAWTEDLEDKLAHALDSQRRKSERVLRAAALHLAAGTAGAASGGTSGSALDQVLGFMGTGAGGRSTADGLKAARDLCKKQPHYCKPEHPPLTLGGVDGVRVYVLGPPHDPVKIKRYNDSKTNPQTYRANELALEAQLAFLAAALPASAQPGPEDGLSSPFDTRLRIDKGTPVYEQLEKEWLTGSDAWRRVDLDWLDSTSALALALDNATNNTSLALAFELGAGGKVLLFPADAQVGNWLSWHDQPWKDARAKTVTAADLLRRTVLYKVGHHCSHNATLQQRGLELMTSRDLVAMIPLDRKTAEKKGWVMPWPRLRKNLVKATQGRILQVDDHSLPAKRPCPADVELAVWKKFQRDVSGNDLYFELLIK